MSILFEGWGGMGWGGTGDSSGVDGPGQRLEWKENSGFLNPKRRKESYSKKASNVMLTLYAHVKC